MKKDLVLVTGGSGFIASHIILQLLQDGFDVRATLRTFAKRDLVEQMLINGGVEDLSGLSFVEASLTNSDGWDDAMVDVDYVMHVASPTPTLNFENESEMIRPAVDGVLMVLKAARDAKVKRVVLTSAYGAVFAGHENRQTPYTEQDWSNLDAEGIHPYQRSKTLAERAAWQFVATEGHGLELAVVNPVAVTGPVLSADYSHSNIQIQEMLAGKVAAVPNVDSGYVDVRDVARLHILAMTSDVAAGERFLATTGEVLSMLDVADTLRNAFPEYAMKLPTTVIADEQIMLAAKGNPMLRMVASLIGKYAGTSNEKSQALLGWCPRSAQSSIIATAQSMIDLGLVK